MRCDSGDRGGGSTTVSGSVPLSAFAVPLAAPIKSVLAEAPGYRVQDQTLSDLEREVAGMTDYVARVYWRDTVAAFARTAFLGLADKRWTEQKMPADALVEFTGDYRAMITTSSVAVRNGSLQLTPHQNLRTGRDASLPDPPVRLAFYAPDRTVVMEGSHAGERCEFLRDGDGRIAWLRWDGRLARRQ